MKLYLEKNRSSYSNNKEGVINFTLSNKTRQLSNNDVSTTFSLFEQYNKERDECERFRLIVNINPICSNILFNTKTEIVRKEGSSSASCLFDKTSGWAKSEVADKALNSTENISYLQAIRDTEYSHKDLGNFVYHCGLDIFNNHMLRNDGFIHINRLNKDDEGEKYNTIEDNLRYEDGSSVSQVLNPLKFNESTPMHLYQYDKILTLKKAFQTRCKEKDGWWGFINPGNINIPNRDDEIIINQMMANNKPCEFIDLYPDRSLFSFNPKFNKYRRRIEKNWDYCITYPYSSNTENVDKICGDETFHSIAANCYASINSNGISILQCESYFKHNLKAGDYISLFYKSDNGMQALNRPIKVMTIGDNNGENEDKVFTIRYSDIASISEHFLKDSENKGKLNFKKNINGIDCLYYTRIFKKIGDLKNDINKVAFGQNIYGDETSQIVFTDDIDITGLKDNKGRKLSEVYLTIVKRNAGNEEWYISGNTSGETVEFSHCFGRVTSGLDFSGIKDEPDEYNIHKMHNINVSNDDLNNYPAIKNTIAILGIAVNNGAESDISVKTIDVLESGITVNQEEFLGDIVEFNPVSYTETVISDVYHRFNTYQREFFDDRFRDIYYDAIAADDYDGSIGTKIRTSDAEHEITAHTVFTYYINDMKYMNNKVNSADTAEDIETLVYGNICPEGYFYKPHVKIKLSEEQSVVSESPAKIINVSSSYTIKDDIITLTAPTNFGFYKGDYVAFYNRLTNETFWAEIMAVSGTNLTLRMEVAGIIKKSEKQNYSIYWSPNNVPTYAVLVPNRHRFIWKTLVPQSQLNDTYDLYETPFSNGRLYLEKNVNFFLRRQDPTGKYGLSIPIYKEGENMLNPLLDYRINGYAPYDFTINKTIFNNFDNCY